MAIGYDPMRMAVASDDSFWKELEIQSCIAKDKPWIIIGDFNVTRKVEEHSAGGSFLSDEMNEFNTCVDKIEVDDIGSSGFHFTWKKSLKNPNCGILKKLDRILVNEGFLSQFPHAYGRFLPYLVPDHSPAILGLTSSPSYKKVFRFMNYVAYKDGFKETVSEQWQKQVDGYSMYKVVKKLKSLKYGLKKLNWNNGDLQKRVEAVKILEEYEAAKVDEVRLLQQQTKLDWLLHGDKNTKYFHSVLKSRKQKCRVDSICDESGNRYYDEQVAEQCVNHFQQFLGKSDIVKPLEEL
ncbi:uncharacterized protein [Rutidosis leptorrhynchoides]|uniref:uncharacterized protein n=1 Tax=Rutidosis leptorrhynchoides TaxID=125765 RepID=UPI003A99DD50